MDPSKLAFSRFPKEQGLYNPALEKDACGVGMIADLTGEPSHQIVKDGLMTLERMTHRGACGCDEASGDGAGITVAIPDEFFRRCLRDTHGVSLPPLGRYAVGQIFMPKAFDERIESRKLVESVVAEFGHQIVCWRHVPVNNNSLGKASAGSEPCTEQLFISADDNVTETEFAAQMYFLRRVITSRMQTQDSAQLYFCSLSPSTIVYKGQLTSGQVALYYIDLGQRDFKSHFILCHSRFSTNTFPSWERAQPLRVLCHNGEINTLRGNSNWMLSRERCLESEVFGAELQKIFPVVDPNTSDSGSLDNVLELLVHSGRSVAEAIAMMIPEPWQNHKTMNSQTRSFYEFNSFLMEPWDGPALVAFTDGQQLGAVLDRNGLRPGRYYETVDKKVILASEAGVLPHIPDDMILRKGRLTPGEMFLVDFKAGKIVSDAQIKQELAASKPYGRWLKENSINLVTSGLKNPVIRASEEEREVCPLALLEKMKAFNYTTESMELLCQPMAANGYEALGSMGNDVALPCLSDKPRRLYDYFQQLFAQVTNPPIDPIRESVVMSLMCPIGPQGNLLHSTAEAAERVIIEEPVISPAQFYALTHLKHSGWEPVYFDITFDLDKGASELQNALVELNESVAKAVIAGAKLIVLSDRSISPTRVPIPSILAVGAVHQHLVKSSLRGMVGIVLECGDAREVHDHSLLLGFGVDAIYPYLVYEACFKFQEEGKINYEKKLPFDKMVENYKQSIHKGLLKVIAKMGISTLQGYKGAQIFEAVGVGKEVINLCFTGCASRIGGANFELFALDSINWHYRAFPDRTYGVGDITMSQLRSPGEYMWRADDEAEVHFNHPDAIAKMQKAVKTNSRQAYKEYSDLSNNLASKCTLRGQLRLRQGRNPVPLDQVESVAEIVKRFSSGAMSYGSISIEAHSTLAVAMNRLGAKSNTGEGGEHVSRYEPLPNGDNARSAIKQVASGRFGVTIHYLTNSDEIQIKMAQGAKPGEGGELPGYKVVGEIAKTRHSTPGVGLISPPPHHDIYSIEDLSQLISDLKNSNPSARISVKLVSEVGVGVVAAGVAKGKADHILISGHDGGTGASKWTGIKHAGLPWELGLAETHQTLVMNGLRGNVVIQTDGQLKTGLDIVKAALLGAEEFCLATAPLIAMGCIMMRKCHLNTCPVGIATQDPQLRKMFSGKPEHVVNYFFLMAEEIRSYMSQLGFRTFNEMVGRADMLEAKPQENAKLMLLDLSSILVPAYRMNPGAPTRCVTTQNHGLDNVLDRQILKVIAADVKAGKKIRADFKIENINRTVGTIISHEVTRRWGKNGLPDDTLHLRFKGSAGQSFGAFCAKGVTLELNGDANDYVGKGLSGGKLVIYPPKNAMFTAESNIIAGNVCLYGATSGHCFIRGKVSQRFAVRNSGAKAVVEGLGDHGCEYMTGGLVVVLGRVGRNFAAGMSGGVAYIYDVEKKLPSLCNLGLVQLEKVEEPEDEKTLKTLIDQHRAFTGSAIADIILWNWDASLEHFVKVIPTEYKKVMMSKKKSVEVKEESKQKNKEDVVKQREMALQKAFADAKKSSKLGSIKDIEDILGAAKNLNQRPGVVANAKKRRGFVEYERAPIPYRKALVRANDFSEIYTKPSANHIKTQAARCMDCGVPFCHQKSTGCPLGNKIPEWNELVFQGRWKDALTRLLETNNFPEFTGRACPAPCEGACVLGITETPVTIKNLEVSIIDRGFEEGWMVPAAPKHRTGKTIAIIGSGPAGLAAADQLNKAGHLVTVFERADRPGGLLMYGVPNMKLDKTLVVKRRIDLMKAEGIIFKCNVDVGVDVKPSELVEEYDALILATGATRPRDLPIPGRELKGVEFAMDFLTPNTKSFLDSRHKDGSYISAAGKDVVVIGGGDTGNDCIGTSARHGANNVINFELLAKPPTDRGSGNPWPQWPRIFRVDYGHKEVKVKYGQDPRHFCVLSKKFLDDGKGNVSGVETVQIKWTQGEDGRWRFAEMPNSARTFKANLVLLAMGFLGPETACSADLNLDLDKRGNYKSKMGNFRTSTKKVFSCGDCRRGQSLIVWAIAEGRQCARQVDMFLMGKSDLPG